MDSASNSAAEHVRLQRLRRFQPADISENEAAANDIAAGPSSSFVSSSLTRAPVMPTAPVAASSSAPEVGGLSASASAQPPPARDGGGDAPAVAVMILLTGDQAQDLIRSLPSSLPAAAGAALSGLASSISVHRDLPETLRPRISSVSSVSGRRAQDMSRPPARSLPAAAGAALCDPVLPASSGSGGSACAFNGFASSSARRDLPETSRPRISCAPRVSRRPLRELSPGLADPTFHGSAISISSSEDEEDRRQAARRIKLQKRLVNSNWRESLPSTSSQGFGGENSPPSMKPATKRGPGRPKGSKNKVKKQTQEKQKNAGSDDGPECHICREGPDMGKFVLTDCGHIFHDRCLDRWVRTSSQKYRTNKVCPYCGGSYQDRFPCRG